VNDRETASAWAQRMLALPPSNVLILDTETCGLHSEVIELAIIDLDGSAVYNRRFSPLTEIEPGAQAVHGLTAEMLVQEPRFADEFTVVRAPLENAAQVLIYNAAFDLRCLGETCRLHKVGPLQFSAACLMLSYAAWFGERAPRGHPNGYRWQKLTGGDHSAPGDARAALALLYRMAGEAP
jgi:DNA polymerase-3 subunit epsilon